MADTKLYLRPIGFLYGAAAQEAMADGLALPLAEGPIAFTAAELIEGAPGNSKARLFTARSLAESHDADLSKVLERVTAARPPFAGRSLDRPLLMGIVNVTPDSFSDGGLYDTKEEAIVHAADLVNAGAAIIDIGGESTRPGSDAVEEDEELGRIVPVLDGLSGLDAVISVDTRKAKVARAAAKAGAAILNDVSAFTYDPQSLACRCGDGSSA
jgi:dihydropteroate synthase